MHFLRNYQRNHR
ncbi:hypothetical protein WG66_012884 [Moniliophthora roreri]|nr:hypothetical protein WG66_012884 [Moniliophthora roreri]